MFSFTLYDVLEKNLSSNAGRTALVLGDTELTYAELARRVDIAAAWLWNRGVRRADRVGVHLHKSVEEVVATFAIARIGAVSVNINHQRTTRQAEHIIRDCDIRIVFTDARKAAQMEAAGLLDALDCLVINGATNGNAKIIGWSDLPSDLPMPNVRPVDRDLACLCYTSGSTGMPKGVMVSHLNFIEGTRRVGSYLRNNADDRILGLVPLSAPWGVLQITTAFIAGGVHVLQPVAFPAEILKTLVNKRVTGMAAFPETWIEFIPFLLETQPHILALRFITSSGGKIPHTTLQQMPKALPGVDVFLTYGLTESFRSTYLPPDMFEKKMGSIGKACPNVDVFIVDPVKGICGPGEQGELIHRGSLVTPGYWRNQAVTDETFRPCEHLRHLIGDEKVHYTGDIVRMDEDGYLWFVSRVDAMIKNSGHRISPTEVEETIYASGLVANVIAYGMDDTERGTGQVVHIAVTGDDKPVDVDALRHYCLRTMPTYMVPRAIRVWEGRMPRTDTGKIDKVKVKAACESAGQ